MKIIVKHIISYMQGGDIATEAFVTNCKSMRFAVYLFTKLVNSLIQDDHEYHEIGDLEAKIYWGDKHKLNSKYPASCSDIFILAVDEDGDIYKLFPFYDFSEE